MTEVTVAHARRDDPDTSQEAAVKATVTKQRVGNSTLLLASQLGLCTGSQLNQEYIDYGCVPVCAWDSPRKRAGELHADGFLAVLGTRDGESEYVVTFAGWEYLKSLGMVGVQS